MHDLGYHIFVRSSRRLDRSIERNLHHIADITEQVTVDVRARGAESGSGIQPGTLRRGPDRLIRAIACAVAAKFRQKIRGRLPQGHTSIDRRVHVDACPLKRSELAQFTTSRLGYA